MNKFKKNFNWRKEKYYHKTIKKFKLNKMKILYFILIKK